jgi:twinkle protein
MVISRDTIEQVKARIDIVRVISQFVLLKSKGSDHVGLCPFHNEKTASFTVSSAKRIYKCFGCGKSGDAISFLMEHGNMTYVQAVQWLAQSENISILEEPMKKQYTKPVERLEKVDKKFIEWFEKRKISNNTLLRMKISEAFEWMPQFEKEVQTICFNYYREEQLVNIKFRGPQKSFKMCKDAELIFYNLDGIKGEKEVIIVEGEIDCLTLIECGIYNVISVPNGAGAGNLKLEYLDNCYSAFEGMQKIILATDSDAPGRSLRDELARRLEIDRCYQVEYPEGCKDLNDVLVKYDQEEVKRVVASAKQWPIQGEITMDEMYETIEDWYEQGYPKGSRARIVAFDQLLTFVPGQMTTITGIPGHGKDEFSNYLMASLAQHEGWIWGIFGPEETPAETVTKLQEKFAQKAFAYRKDVENRMNRRQFEWSIAMVDQYFKIINPDEIQSDVNSLLELATQFVKRYGINGLYLNPWNWIEHMRDGHLSETEYTSKTLGTIIKWARKYGVHVFLLAHTTKIGKENGRFSIPNLYSISGSAHFYNKTHNGITVYRDFEGNTTTVYVQKVKQSWLGQTGWVCFTYDTLTRQYSYHSSSLKEVDQRASIQIPAGPRPINLPYPDDKDDDGPF